MARPDFTTPPHPPQLGRWWYTKNLPAVMRRIWAVEPRAVSPQCWRWLTLGGGPPWQGEQR